MMIFMQAITEKSLRTTVALTAGRGRGKSAALGLAIAGAIAFGFVRRPLPGEEGSGVRRFKALGRFS